MRNVLLGLSSRTESLRASILLALTAAPACSFLVDDSRYACASEGGCAVSVERNDGGAANASSAVCRMDTDCGGTLVCSEGRCLPCRPHTLCGPEADSLCLPEGASASCKPLLEPSIGCNLTIPEERKSLLGKQVFHAGMIALWPNAVESSDYGVPPTLGIEAAVSEINAGGGLRTPMVGVNRPLLLVACNEAPRSEADKTSDDKTRPYLAPVVQHLAATLQSPAILGGSTSGATSAIDRTHLVNLQSDALLLSPSATSDTLVDFARTDKQLFWRSVAPDSIQIPAHRALVSQVQQTLRSQGKDPGKPFAVVDITNPALEAFAIALGQQGLDFTTRPYSPSNSSDVDKAVAEVLAQRPRIIIPLGTGTFVKQLLARIEDGWSAGVERPWYVTAEGERGSFTKEVLGAVLSKHPDLPARVLGTVPGARDRTAPGSLYGPFELTYATYYKAPRQNRFRPTPGPVDPNAPGNLAENGYDAVYLLAYAATHAAAAAALSDAPLAWPRGPALADALTKFSCVMPPIQSLGAFNNNYAAAANALMARPDACFDFAGASGNMDYGQAQRSSRIPKPLEPSSNVSFWCLGAPAAADLTVNLRSAYWKTSEGALSAALSLSDPSWCATAVK